MGISLRQKVERTEVLVSTLSQGQCGYIAGLIDGEGSIQIDCGRHRGASRNGVYPGYCLQLIIANTNTDVIQWLLVTLGGTSHVTKYNPDRWKPQYFWRISGGSAQAIVRSTLPYLIIKRAQADIALRYPVTYKKGFVPVKEELYKELRVLNKRGVSVA